MRQEARRMAAFLLTLTMVWQSGSFVCCAFAQTAYAEPFETDSAEQETQPSTSGTELRAGDHVLLGAFKSTAAGTDKTVKKTEYEEKVQAVEAESPGAAFGGYDFTVLSTAARSSSVHGQRGGLSTGGAVQTEALLLLRDPRGLEGSPQQFDAALEDAAGGHPDEDSRLDGYSLWTESDLYTALNGSTAAGNDDTHESETAAARSFYERLSANADEWEALLPHTEGGSDGEKVSLLSELEFETHRGELEAQFWYTEDEASGFWLKTARPGYTNQVRYIFSGDIPPSLSADAYYAVARETRAVRPALLLDLRRVVFGAGNGTETDPYRDLSLRPPVTLTLRVTDWNPKNAAQAALTGEAAEAAGVSALQAESATAGGIGRCIQTVTVEGITAGMSFDLQVKKTDHITYRQYAICLAEDTELTVSLPCGDVNGDGSIDLTDRQLLLSAIYFGRSVPEGTAETEQSKERRPPDLDGDGKTGLSDLYIVMLAENFGKRACVR